MRRPWPPLYCLALDVSLWLYHSQLNLTGGQDALDSQDRTSISAARQGLSECRSPLCKSLMSQASQKRYTLLP